MLVRKNMKILRNILACSFAITLASMNGVDAQNMRSYTNKSVLSSGRIVKIRVQEEGFYSFTYDELRNMGFSNPKNVHLRGYGGELLDENFTESNQYIDDLKDQPVVDFGNKIVFYLRGVVGLTATNAISLNNIGFSENYASDYSYYFLHEENTEAKKIEFADELEEQEIKETTYTAIKWKKYDDVNIAKSGRNWYGNKFSNGDNQWFHFNFPNMIIGEKAQIYSNVASSSKEKSRFTMSTDLIQKAVDFLGTNDYDFGYDWILEGQATQTTSNILSVNYRYTDGATTGVGYIDYIIAAAKCNLKGNVGYQTIPVAPSIYDSKITYAALNSTSNIQVWDVSEISDIKRVPTRMSKDSLIFTVKTRPTVGRYIMANLSGKLASPEVVGKVDNQNLHALKDIEYVIVTNPEFMEPAMELAEFHKVEDGMSVAVVTAEQVYNEFSSGTPDPTAIRAFMKMLWDKAYNSDYGVFPQYLLLMGDGTYDNIGRLKKDDFNKMITYQSINSLNETKSYTNDDYFGYVEDYTMGYNSLYTNRNINIGVGRFPVSKLSQAEALVKKVKQYYASELGDWRKKIISLGDDNEKNTTNSGFHSFLSHQEEAISVIESKEPRMDVTRIYWDNYTRDVSGGSGRFPEVTSNITKKFSEGALLFNYLGHSSYTAISEEHSYSISQAQSLYNKILPVWYAGSCNLSQFDGFSSSFGEEIMLNPNGGAIASIGSVRTAYAAQNLSLDKDFLRQLFNPENEYRLGKIYKAAKTARGQDNNKLVYILLGDPGLKLKVPDLNLVVDTVVTLHTNGTIGKADTIKALSKVKISCHVEDEFGNTMTQFNGIANATLKDKLKDAFTKGNKIGIIEHTPYSYEDRQSTLFSGSTSVTNGKFEFQMIIPKDINYNIGYGRLSMYAYDNINGWDAMGANDSLLVGGSTTDVISDHSGPSIELSANGESYEGGYKVNPTPMIYVDLSDKSGINATGSSIGHNITLTIDNNTEKIYNLNQYFKYNLGSCTDGTASFHIDEVLSEGWHTITVKAWDLQNNSSEATFDIYVSESLAPEIETLTVYPNPAKDKFFVYIKTNRPEEVQTLECSLSEMSGRQISRKELKDKPTNGIWTIEWNLNDNGRVAPGLYLLYVRVATGNSDFAEKTEKVLVIAQ